MLEPWAGLSVDETNGIGLVFVPSIRDVACLDAVDEQFVAVLGIVTADDNLVGHQPNLPLRSRLVGPWISAQSTATPARIERPLLDPPPLEAPHYLREVLGRLLPLVDVAPQPSNRGEVAELTSASSSGAD